MLKKLNLTNFRKHEKLDLTFESGLVVLRGNNEAGKSTIFQAIAYALFGARALPQPLAEVVTNGKSESALRVTLEARLSGVEILVDRSKAGCELHHAGGIVTGQDACTEFIQNLVGAPANLAASLWFANQNSIRGALASGTKATTSLIETLADFGEIDRIIELVQAHLTTGPTKQYEERLAQALETLALIGEPQAPEDQTEALERMGNSVARAELAAKSAEALRVKHGLEVLAPLVAASAAHKRALDLQEAERRNFAAAGAKLRDLKVPAYDEQGHQAALQKLAQAKDASAIAAAYSAAHKAFLALPIVTSVWEGDGPSFVAFCEKSEAEYEENRNKRGEIQARAADLSSQTKVGSCGVCGLDYDSIPAIGEKNKAALAALKEAHRALDENVARGAELEAERTAIKLINKQWQIYRDFLAKHEAYVKVDNGFVPPKVEWSAAAPAQVDSKVLQAEVDRHAAASRARERALGEQKALTEAQAAASAQMEAARQEALRAYEKTEGLEEAEEKAKSLQDLATARLQEVATLRQEAQAARQGYEQALAMFEERRRTWKLAHEQAEQARAQLVEVNFNNVLLKKVRSARPVIVDRLWSTLLAAVGHYFSLMRGVPSVVTRVEGAFLVDGRPVEGLSGSTLDVLGLAVRVALLKTFLPSCSFLVLDEPAAACDDEREAALIGTIASAQFDQVVLVSHSSVPESFASQLVTL